MTMHTKSRYSAISSVTRCLLLAAGLITTAMAPHRSLAQPYTPDSNNSIVDTLPAAIVELSADIRRQQASSSQLVASSGADILQQAMAAYRVAVSSGEARAYGHTLSILERWPEQEIRPAMYHILLAAVRQHNHEFDTSLMQLQHVTTAVTEIRDRSSYIQALMMQSQIGLVTGDYALVDQSCDALRTSARRPTFINCQAQLDGVTGDAQKALSTLSDTLRAGADLNTQDYQELLTTAAVLAHRLGDLTQAEGYYRSALQLAPTNSYLIVNFSNLLLESNRQGEVITLLSSNPDDALNAEMNILLAKALRSRGSDADHQRADRIITQLEQDFELAFMRNEAIPHKEYAQYALELADLPAAALRAAKENWALQKEPSDTLLLAAAAAADNDHETINEIEQWVRATGTEDVKLQSILSIHRESTP